jgi:hypothetical protein
VEVFLGKFLRSLELHENGASSTNLRDRLSYAVKRGLVRDVETWLEMREYSNKIAHDCLPEQLVTIYAAIRGRFAAELAWSVVAARKAAAGVR